MKLAFRDIEPFVNKPNPQARAILIYGPDDGLMRERTKKIAGTITDDLNDPFNAATLKGSDLAENPGALSDEAHAMSMMGGARVVIVYDASDKNTAGLKSYLENPSQDNLVILQGGDLGPRSSLRILFEKSDVAAALPCYVMEGHALTDAIQTSLSTAGLRIDPDALNYLSQNLVGDYAQMRSEIEKLITYIGPVKKQISLDDAMNNTGALSEQKLDALVYACAGGNNKEAEQLLQGLLSEGAAGVLIMRALQNHFRKLLYVQLQCDQGMQQLQAIKSLRPPLFFKLENSFKAQLSKWPSAKIRAVLAKLSDLEADLKSSASPESLLLQRSIFGLTQMAR